ncbi:hypothetical protein BSKO_00173 [Bryopsis sp. KO-2023]|nr:hypothetical protein BSKO_00173 [Bryopsis sp. KO-2023]
MVAMRLFPRAFLFVVLLSILTAGSSETLKAILGKLIAVRDPVVAYLQASWYVQGQHNRDVTCESECIEERESNGVNCTGTFQEVCSGSVNEQQGSVNLQTKLECTGDYHLRPPSENQTDFLRACNGSFAHELVMKMPSHIASFNYQCRGGYTFLLQPLANSTVMKETLACNGIETTVQGVSIGQGSGLSSLSKMEGMERHHTMHGLKPHRSTHSAGANADIECDGTPVNYDTLCRGHRTTKVVNSQQWSTSSCYGNWTASFGGNVFICSGTRETEFHMQEDVITTSCHKKAMLAPRIKHRYGVEMDEIREICFGGAGASALHDLRKSFVN